MQDKHELLQWFHYDAGRSCTVIREEDDVDHKTVITSLILYAFVI